MATINFPFFLLALSTLLAPYHARQLNDACIYVRFGRRPPLQAAPEIIQMVIGEEKLRSPPSYARDNPKTPPSPRVAPSDGQKTYGGDYQNLAPPLPESAYGRDNTRSPPSPEKSPSRGQATYGGDNQKLAPPLPVQEYGRDNTKSPPSPEVAPPRGETIYGRDNRKSKGQTTYGREDPKTPPTPDPSDPRIQFVDGRVDPMVLAESTCPILKEFYLHPRWKCM